MPGLRFLSGLRAAQDTLKKENKSLIVMWMGGGPSHMDLWDLKPGEKTNIFEEIKTKAPGIDISELLPSVAGVMDKLSIIRSLITNEGSHDRGTTLMNTGRMPNPVVQYPSIGSITSSLISPKDLALPGFIGVGGTAQRIGPGFLGMNYAPFTVQNAGQPPANIAAPASLGNGEEAALRQRRRQRLFYDIEDTFRDSAYPHLTGSSSKEKEIEAAMEAVSSAAQAHETVYHKAFDLTISPLRAVFDVAKEDNKTKDLYGGQANQFGMGLLLARKLIEKGVTCVEVDLGGWDNHGNIKQALAGDGTKNMGNAGRLDKGMGGLVKDLVDRGMWKNTVMVWMGDFGRTPKINQGNGRDHWPKMSVVVGGGAINGGVVYGSTTKDGMDVDQDKCSVADLYATIYKGLGIDPDTPIRDNLGRPTKIAEGGKALKGVV
jgi:uncharacterized protein (DUF1501 family)